MTVIYHDHDADLGAIAGSRVAVVGYGQLGAAWARNLRDGGHEVIVCTRPGPSAERAAIDGFTPRPLKAGADADILCLLVPEGVVSTLPFDPPGWAITVLASGAPLASHRFDPNGDVGMIAPRVGPAEVRRRFVSGEGWVSAVGVHHDRTGKALERLLGLAKAVGGLRQGAIAMSAAQETLLAVAVEQALRPELEAVCTAFLQAMVEHGVPIEAVISELVVGNDRVSASRLLGGYPGRSVEGARARIGFALRRVVDDLAAGRLDSHTRPGLGALLSTANISAEELVIDLRARLDASTG
jgi:ketol-acid reductoisomerase